MKKRTWILLGLSAFLLVLAIGAFFVLLRVQSVKFYTFDEREGSFSFNGKFFTSSDSSFALLYRPLERRYEKSDLQEIDLGPYGFEGETFSCFVFGDILYAAGEAAASYEGFWPVSTPEKFIFIKNDAKYVIDTAREKSYPLFSGSIDGVDEEAKIVSGFSSDGVFAAGVDGNEAVIFISDTDPDSFKIASSYSISLSEWGENAKFGAFLGKTTAYFTVENNGEEQIVVVDCSARRAVPAALPAGVQYTKKLGRLYAERENTEKEAQDEKKIHLGWNNRILGDSFSAALPKKEFSQAELLSVSADGRYGIVSAVRDGKREILVCRGKQYASLSAFCGTEEFTAIDFSYDNVLFLQFCDGAGQQKALSTKISF